MNLDLLRLSRDLERSYLRYLAFRSGLRHSSSLPHPFGEAPFPGRTQLDEVCDLPSDDPMKEPLSQWLQFLIEERIQVPATQHEAWLLRFDAQPIDSPVSQPVTLEECRQRALKAVVHGQDAEAKAWWQAYDHRENIISDHRRVCWQRRLEIRERLRVARRGPELTISKVASAGPEQALAETRELAEEWIEPGLSSLERARLGLGAMGPWPARLASDTIQSLLGARELWRGLSLPAVSLPSRLAPTSFALAAYRVGEAVAAALTPGDLPFVVRSHPAQRAGAVLGWVLANWVGSRAFAKRRLGASRPDADNIALHMGVAKAADLRMCAGRTILFEGIIVGQDAFDQSWGRVQAEVLRRSEPASAALGRLHPSWDEPVRWESRQVADRLVSAMIETYDEDWLDDPRCQEDLRARFATPDTPGTELFAEA